MTFDLHRFTHGATRLAYEDLDFDTFASQPLDRATLRCLRYMHDVEYHTACYLRDLLVTPAHADPAVTAFLSVWGYEEFWHGEALAAVLAAHGEPHGAERVETVRSGLGWRDRLRPIAMAVGGWCAGEEIVALQMAWGALNEATTQAGYQLLGATAGHRVLGELVRRISRQEAMHLGFYMSEARRRLAASARARRITRFALARLWRPVGSGLMADIETAFLRRHLLVGPVAREKMERIDRRMDSLPGLSGLALATRSLEPSGPPGAAALRQRAA